MVDEVESLADLATKVSVGQANLLRKHAGIIPPTLYHRLMLASIKTNRVLSIRTLLLSWPLPEMCLANCKDFTPEHASMMAHCLQEVCNRLCFIDLNGCNTGVQGTNLLLKLATGSVLPNADEYGINNGLKRSFSKKDNGVAWPVRLRLQADCFIDQDNFPLFLDALENQMVLDFRVSCLHAVELGSKRIRKLLKKVQLYQAQFVSGLDFEMNGLPSLEVDNMVDFSERSVKKEQRHKPSPYCFIAFKSFCNLKYINLSGNIIGQYVIFMILSNLSDMAHLTHLLLNSCNIGPEKYYINEISELNCIQKLEHLELANNRLENVDYLMKLFLRCCRTLVNLNLEMNGFGQHSGPTIQKLLKAPFKLKELHIGKNKLLPSDFIQFNLSLCHITF